MSLLQWLHLRLFKQRFLHFAVVIITIAVVVFQPHRTSAVKELEPLGARGGCVDCVKIPTTPISLKQAPFSQVFFTGSAYAVKDKDYEPSEPSFGLFSLWSANPTNNQLLVNVRYCLPTYSLIAANAHLSAIALLDKQPLVTIDQSIEENLAQLREIQPGYTVPSHGFGDPFDDQFLNPLDENFDYAFGGIHQPGVACSSGSNRFDLTKLSDTLSRLPNKTLQVKLVFSDGETQNWHLGKATVKAIKDLLSIRQQLMTK